LGEGIGEELKVCVVSEAKRCKLLFLEPPDGVVFARRVLPPRRNAVTI
jgi:hypothetical protein